MQNIKRMRYHTGNSWNGSTAPAYNLKVHKVINKDLQANVFELLETDSFYSNINHYVNMFNAENDYAWQAGFNGRSGGYLVLYRGEKKPSEYKSYCTECGQQNFETVESTGKRCYKCGENARVNFETPAYSVSVYPYRHIDDSEVPVDVLKRFRRLAIDIVKATEAMAKDCQVVEEEYTVAKTRKVIRSA